MPVVAKPFNSTTRRFRVGDNVAESDDLSPHTFADLRDRKFITDEPAPPADRQPPRPARAGR